MSVENDQLFTKVVLGNNYSRPPYVIKNCNRMTISVYAPVLCF